MKHWISLFESNHLCDDRFIHIVENRFSFVLNRFISIPMNRFKFRLNRFISITINWFMSAWIDSVRCYGKISFVSFTSLFLKPRYILIWYSLTCNTDFRKKAFSWFLISRISCENHHDYSWCTSLNCCLYKLHKFHRSFHPSLLIYQSVMSFIHV